MVDIWLIPSGPSGKRFHNYGESMKITILFYCMGKLTVWTGPISIAMLDYQRVSGLSLLIHNYPINQGYALLTQRDGPLSCGSHDGYKSLVMVTGASEFVPISNILRSGQNICYIINYYCHLLALSSYFQLVKATADIG